jgi:hypothetical protein
MSVTRLKRKHRKNIARANNEVRKIKNLLRTPVLKNVDLDELKAKFGQVAPPDVAAKSNVPPAHQEHTPAVQPTEAKTEAKPAAEQKAAKAEAKAEAPAGSLLDKVTHAAAAAADAVKHVASDAAEAVAHNSLVEKATSAVQEAAHNLVEGAKHALESKSPEENQATEANQTGKAGFDAAEAETKPVTEEGQAGEHPKPEIAL